MVAWRSLDGIQKWKAYFLEKPTIELLKSILKCYDIDNINDTKIIQKNKIDDDVLAKRYISLLPEFAKYLQPRILNTYFYTSPITFYNCISILKNVAFWSKHILLKYEVVQKKRKIIQYKVVTQGEYEVMNIRIFSIDRSTKRLCIFD